MRFPHDELTPLIETVLSPVNVQYAILLEDGGIRIMNRSSGFRSSVVLLIAVTLSMLLLTPVATAGETVVPEPHWQLFLDNHAITRSTGFQRMLHQPEARGIVLEGTEDWEQRPDLPESRIL